MKSIVDFFNKWGYTVFLSIFAVLMLFALGCCIYTSIKNLFVGIVGIVGVLVSLLAIGANIYWDVKTLTK